MKAISNINAWINKNEVILGIAVALATFLAFILTKDDNKILAITIPLFAWFLHSLSQRLLGNEYPNKIEVFTPGKDKTPGFKLFLFFYISLAISAVLMMVFKTKYAFVFFIAFIIISFIIGLMVQVSIMIYGFRVLKPKVHQS